MVSLELAQKLKAAGMKWKPDIIAGTNKGDWFYWPDGTVDLVGGRDYHLNNSIGEIIFAPRLDQLLAEIEARGYKWSLNAYKCWVVSSQDYDNDNLVEGERLFTAANPTDAAAKALLWILEQSNA